MICANCKSEIPATSKFCKKCGTSINAAPALTPETKVCPSCGAINAANAKFCKTDGHHFDAPAPAPALAPVTVAPAMSPPVQPPPPSSIPAVKIAPPVHSEPVPTPVSSPVTASFAAQSNPKVQADSVATDPGVGLACPSCGTINPPTAKFCKKDGVALGASAANTAPAVSAGITAAIDPQAHSTATAPSVPAPPRPAPVKVPAAPVRQTTAGAQISSPPISNVTTIAVLAVVVLAASGGGAWWYLGRSAKTETVAAQTPAPAADTTSPVEPVEPPPLPGMTPSASVPSQAAAESDKVRDQIVASLTDAGFSGIAVEVDANYVVSLAGQVANPQEREKLLALVASIGGVNGVKEQIGVAQQQAIPVVPSVASPAPQPRLNMPMPPTQAVPTFDAYKVQQSINRQLHEKGLAANIRVNNDRTAVLSGTVGSTREKEAAEILVAGSPELSGVRSTIQVVTAALPPTSVAIDPAKLEGEANRALRNGGSGGITAQVGDDLTLTLKGSGSAAQKDTALRIANNFKGVRRVRDQVFVVEQ